MRRVFASRDLLVTLVERHFRLRLKRSWMGIILPSIVPFVLAFLYVYVFKRVLDVPIPRYTDYLLCALIPWVFFQQAAVRGMSTISTEPEILAKAPFPHALLPISAVVTHALNLLLALAVFIGYLAIAGNLHLETLPLVLPPLLCLVLFTMAFTMLLALADVYNQDLRHVLPFVLTVWFFVIPIVYRTRQTPSVMRQILTPEPMHLVVGHFRAALYSGTVPPVDQIIVMVVVATASFVFALLAVQHVSPRLPEDV